MLAAILCRLSTVRLAALVRLLQAELEVRARLAAVDGGTSPRQSGPDWSLLALILLMAFFIYFLSHLQLGFHVTRIR